jgi:hypothetical protein
MNAYLASFFMPFVIGQKKKVEHAVVSTSAVSKALTAI